MTDTLPHRGPDGEGFYLSPDGRVGLGHRRLAIIDLATGDQPMSNEEGTVWIVFNGEIYNYPKLRAELLKKGHRFFTQSDTEVIIHAYEEYGKDCVKKFNGMFAFALWDGKKRELFLARDPLGKKPLHFAFFNNQFVFSSEIKGILAHPEFKKEINLKALRKYLFYGFIPAPETIFKGVKKLLPGHFMVVDEGSCTEARPYWRLDFSTKQEKTEAEVEESVIKHLQEAVRKRLISDVPLGVFLSGGVDSGMVVAMMAQLLPPNRVEAFSVGFEEKAFDESEYAIKVAKHLNVNHHLKIFSQSEVLELIPKIADFLDEPMADPSLVPSFLLSRFTRKRVKVALSGDGGDETFAGYPKYVAHSFLLKTRLSRAPLSPLARFFPGRGGAFLRYASYPLHLRNQLWISQFSPREVEELTGEEMSFDDLEGYHQVFNGLEPLDEAFFLDLKLTLPDLYLVKTDRASMAASLEVRCPFLDKNLVEFSAKIPSGVKLRSFQTKALLKRVAKSFLPKEVIYRPKMGFGIPLARWLKNDLKPLIAEKLSSQKIKKEGVLDERGVKEVVEKNNPNQIWTLLVFELWLRKWLS